MTSGFHLSGFVPCSVGEEQFSHYQTAWRQMTEPDTPDRISRIISLASAWIRNCNQTHQNCRSHSAKREPIVSPTRVINVGTGVSSQPPRLVIPPSHHDSFEYIALSYAWGSDNFVKTMSSNLEAMTDHLPWPQLPKTIQDAIMVTRRRGIKYLWVDALCILQSEGPDDMKHKEDWSYEAARFGKYYENAVLTIAATGASSSDQGLFLKRPILQFQPKFINLQRGQPFSFTIRSPMLSWYSETSSGPLSKRGWAIQERLLSRRVLHLAENMVLWECHDCRATELDPEGLSSTGPDDNPEASSEFTTKFRDIYTKGLEPKKFLREWYGFAKVYSQSDFTFISDRLPALSGIVSIIQKCTQNQYIAGLWKSDIPKGLTWVSYGDFRFHTAHLIDPQITSSPVKAESQIILPSWSWAVCERSVLYIDCHDWRPLVELESCQINSEGTTTSGQLRGAKLTLRGRLAMINLTDLKFKPYMNTRIQDNALTRQPDKTFLTKLFVCMDSKMDSQTRHTSHPCLLIGRDSPYNGAIGQTLILKPTGNCSGLIKEYRRIGYMSLLMIELVSIFNDEETTIDLI